MLSNRSPYLRSTHETERLIRSVNGDPVAIVSDSQVRFHSSESPSWNQTIAPPRFPHCQSLGRFRSEQYSSGNHSVPYSPGQHRCGGLKLTPSLCAELWSRPAVWYLGNHCRSSARNFSHLGSGPRKGFPRNEKKTHMYARRKKRTAAHSVFF
jgi:hypothetical protein